MSSEAGAVRLYAADIVAALVSGLSSSQWSRKKTCAGAVVQLTEVRAGRWRRLVGALGRGSPGLRAADPSRPSRPAPTHSPSQPFPSHPQPLPHS